MSVHTELEGGAPEPGCEGRPRRHTWPTQHFDTCVDGRVVVWFGEESGAKELPRRAKDPVNESDCGLLLAFRDVVQRVGHEHHVEGHRIRRVPEDIGFQAWKPLLCEFHHARSGVVAIQFALKPMGIEVPLDLEPTETGATAKIEHPEGVDFLPAEVRELSEFKRAPAIVEVKGASQDRSPRVGRHWALVGDPEQHLVQAAAKELREHREALPEVLRAVIQQVVQGGPRRRRFHKQDRVTVFLDKVGRSKTFNRLLEENIILHLEGLRHIGEVAGIAHAPAFMFEPGPQPFGHDPQKRPVHGQGLLVHLFRGKEAARKRWVGGITH